MRPLPRLRGRAGEGEAACSEYVASPSPPSPASGGGGRKGAPSCGHEGRLQALPVQSTCNGLWRRPVAQRAAVRVVMLKDDHVSPVRDQAESDPGARAAGAAAGADRVLLAFRPPGEGPAD